MRLLLDTHVWLWALESPERLSLPARNSIQDANEVVISVASVWELAIKEAYGKISVVGGLERLRAEASTSLNARELEIRTEHALVAARLPVLHKDPFDRMLLAQAKVEGLFLVTADEAVLEYGGNILSARS